MHLHTVTVYHCVHLEIPRLRPARYPSITAYAWEFWIDAVSFWEALDEEEKIGAYFLRRCPRLHRPPQEWHWTPAGPEGARRAGSSTRLHSLVAMDSPAPPRPGVRPARCNAAQREE